MLDILVIKMRSNVWMHFMPVSDDKAKRDICQSELSYKGGSTSNLSKRLKANHVSITEACGLPSKSKPIAVASSRSMYKRSSTSADAQAANAASSLQMDQTTMRADAAAESLSVILRPVARKMKS